MELLLFDPYINKQSLTISINDFLNEILKRNKQNNYNIKTNQNEKTFSSNQPPSL